MNVRVPTLAELCCRADVGEFTTACAIPLTGLAMDSRKVRPGNVFLAVPGRVTDGRCFIADAVAHGATAVLVEGSVREEDRAAAGTVPILAVDELSHHVGRLAATWYDDPSRALRVLGVTGTNGKTSCIHHLAQLLTVLGERAGLCGSLGNGFPGALHNTGRTTADVVTLTSSLAMMRDAGAHWAALEVSSHALDQERTANLHFSGALLTNLSRDHLDYHGTMDAYGEAKRLLFLAPGVEVGVVNRDDSFARYLPARIPAAIEVFDYSLTDPAAALHLTACRTEGDMTVAEVASVWGRGCLQTVLPNGFVLSNLLGTLTLLAGLGLRLTDLLEAAAEVKPVPGRLQAIAHPHGFTCVIDYAHTPDALARALALLRGRFPGRVFCVFGCGGERDAGKRPLMGEVAAAGADHIVLTDDNPRGEDRGQILAQIAAGIGPGVAVTIEHDRAVAIERACAEAGPDDVVLIAGKGHENYQEVARGRLPYSDLAVVESLVGAAVEEKARCCSG